MHVAAARSWSTIPSPLRRPFEVVATTVRLYIEDGCSTYAAAIAYYAAAFGAEVHHREVVERDGVEEALVKVAESYIQLTRPTRPDSYDRDPRGDRPTRPDPDRRSYPSSDDTAR